MIRKGPWDCLMVLGRNSKCPFSYSVAEYKRDKEIKRSRLRASPLFVSKFRQTQIHGCNNEYLSSARAFWIM